MFSMVEEVIIEMLKKASEIAQNANISIANAYQLKTGKTLEELLNMMGEETWLNPQQAVKLGLADGVNVSRK